MPCGVVGLTRHDKGAATDCRSSDGSPQEGVELADASSNVQVERRDKQVRMPKSRTRNVSSDTGQPCHRRSGHAQDTLLVCPELCVSFIGKHSMALAVVGKRF